MTLLIDGERIILSAQADILKVLSVIHQRLAPDRDLCATILSLAKRFEELANVKELNR